MERTDLKVLKKFAVVFCALMFFIGFSLINAPITNATTLTVTNSDDSGTGSLRDTIALANDGDVIEFAPGITDIVLDSEIEINVAITINGNGNVTIDGDGNRIFEIEILAGSFELSGLTFTNGYGAISADIYDSEMTISDCVFTDNKDGTLYASVHQGKITISDCTFTDNTAENGSGGAIQALNDESELMISDCIFEENTAGNGGAIYTHTQEGKTTLNDCTFTNNTATSSGGAIDAGVIEGEMALNDCTFTDNTATSYNDYSTGGAIRAQVDIGNIAFTNCEFTGNEAKYTYEFYTGDEVESYGDGGAVYAETNAGDLTFINCTFKENVAGGTIYHAYYDEYLDTGGNGGAICAYVLDGEMTLTDCTIADSIAYDGGGVFFRGSDYYGGTYGSLTINGGEISDNKALHNGGGIFAGGENFVMDDCTVSGNTAKYDGGGILLQGIEDFTMSDSIISSNTAYVSGGGLCIWYTNFTMESGEISGNKAAVGGDEYLLGGGGGIAVLSDSHFIMNGGKIFDNFADDHGGGGVSVGSATFTMNGGEIYNNTAVLLGGGVGLGISYGEFIMEGGEIYDNTAAIGGGVGIAFAKFTMNAGKIYENTSASYGGGVSVTLNGEVTITGGEVLDNAAVFGGGIGNFEYALCYGDYEGHDHADDYAAGGYLTIEGGAIDGNTATYGGGVFVEESEMAIDGGTISNNTATYGGGIYIDENGNLGNSYIDGGTIDGNTATYGGGVMLVQGDLLFGGGVISRNTAKDGGGIYISDSYIFTEAPSAITYGDGQISDNTATGNGGGIYLARSSDLDSCQIFMLQDVVISGNTAGGNGGGAYVEAGAELYMSDAGFGMDASIINNKAMGDGGGIYAEDYNNLIIDENAVFSGNTARWGFWLEDEQDSFEYDPGSGSIRVDALITLHDTMIGATSRSDSGSKAFTYLYNNYDINFVGATYTVTVHFVDEDGTELDPQDTFVVPSSRAFTATAHTISGYVFSDWKIGETGTLKGNTNPTIASVSGNTDIYLVYEEAVGATYTVTVHYVDKDGKELAPQTSVVVADGGTFIARAQTISGYVFSDWKLGATGALNGNTNPTIASVSENADIYLVYEKVIASYTVIVHYMDKDGKELAPQTSVVVADGSTFTAKAPKISGYTFSDWKLGATGTLSGNTNPTIASVNGNTEIYLIYNKASDSGTKAPSTGDNSVIWLFVIPMVLSLVTAVSLIYKKKRSVN